jgi:hypothetical protein
MTTWDVYYFYDTIKKQVSFLKTEGRMTKKQDVDVKAMSAGQLRREVMKLRRKIRWHRDRDENQRCHHCDDELYTVLPEVKPSGQMTEPESSHKKGLFKWRPSSPVVLVTRISFPLHHPTAERYVTNVFANGAGSHGRR